MLKKGEELRISANFEWNGLTGWKCKILGIEWWASKYIKGFFEVAREQ